MRPLAWWFLASLVVLLPRGVAAQGADGLAPPPPSKAPTPAPEPTPTPAETEAPASGEATETVDGDDATPPGGTSSGSEDGDEDGEAEGGTKPTAEAVAEGGRRRIAVIDATTYGVDPVVGEHVTVRIRTTAGELGYEVLSREETVQAAQTLRMPYPPAPADLWRVTWVARAQRGAFARVWAHEGRYVVEVVVASLDGAGPFFARGTAGADNLHEVVAGLTRQALPKPDAWNAAEAERLSNRQGPAAEGGGVDATETALEAEFEPEKTGEQEPAEELPKEPLRRFSLAFQTEAAIGTSSHSFYNHLFGLRADVRITREVILGAYFAYANLNGRNGRAHNILPMLQIEDRVRVSTRSDITIPLRFSLGYLPYNGPVVRLAAGVNIPLGSNLELGFDLLTPTFWMLDDRTAVSFDLGAELVVRL